MKSPGGEVVISVHSYIYYGLKIVIFGLQQTYLRVTKSGDVFKFVWMQVIHKPNVTVFKSFVNKISINHIG